MSSRHRKRSESGIYHVMNRGVDRQRVFFSNADRVEFGQLLGLIFDDYQVETLAYCLMTNHYHLLLSDPQHQLSEAMHRFGSRYVRHVNDRIGRDGPLFRDRFHSIPVTSDTYFVWVARYIHRNALDLADVRSVSDYRWSSYRAYLGHRRPPAFLNLAPLLDQFGGSRPSLTEFTETDAFDSSKWREADSCNDLIAFALAEEAMNRDTPLPKRAADSIRCLLETRGLAPITPGRSVDATRKAQRRAERRLVDDATIGRVLNRIVGLVDVLHDTA